MTSDTYPRDLVGYGRNPPYARFPGNARIAVQFVINYDDGRGSSIAHGDGVSQSLFSEDVGAKPWLGQLHTPIASIYEYGARAGLWRLLRIFTERQLPATVFAVASAMKRNPEAVVAMKEADWEIASHGLQSIDYRDFSEQEERAHILEAIRIHTEVAGSRPLGFYQGRTSANTLALIMEEQGFLYSADSYADDLPYWVEGPHGPQLVVPYSLDANDLRFASAQGLNSGDQFFAYLKDSFDVLYAEGVTSPRLLSIGLHCHLSGRPGVAGALVKFLDYVQSHDRVWVPTRLSLARHWIATHPPEGGYQPSNMSRTLFVERYCEIFEHSPQIAERTHRAGLTVTENSSAGLHAALMKTVLALPMSEKLALVRAHPELAGQEASAGSLTADSSSEQGRLGFTMLTRAEFDRVAEINRRYRETFGFPCIVALALHARRESVISEMEARLTNSFDAEISKALEQIGHITRARLARKFPA